MDEIRIPIKAFLVMLATMIIILVLSIFLIVKQDYKQKTIFDKIDSVYIERTDTLIDTLTYIKPQHSTEILLIQKTDSVLIKKNDTLFEKQEAILPITQKKYEDSTYVAYVSGYQPNLDSIKVYQRKVETVYNRDIISIVKEKDKRKFGIGIIGGYGVGNSGFSPYVGVGVSYNIFKF